MPFFTTPDGCDLYYKHFGPHPSRCSVVFLNGLSQTTLYWHHCARKLAADYPALCYDARAQGRSGTGDLPLTPQQHAEDLRALMNHLGTGQVVLAGLSHGAYVACAFAAQDPGRTAGLFLCGAGASAGPGRKKVLDQWQATLAQGGLAALARSFIATAFGQAFTERYRPLRPAMEKSLVMRNRADALSRQLAALSAYPPLAEFTDRIQAPARILRGSQDRLITRNNADRLARQLGTDLVSLDGVGHSLPVEAPKAFQKYLSTFLSERCPRIRKPGSQDRRSGTGEATGSVSGPGGGCFPDPP